MKTRAQHFGEWRRKGSGFTVAELMVAVAISGIALAVIAALSLYGLKSFTAIGNYTDMDGKSRAALDEISRDLRECTDLLEYDFSTNAPYFKFANSNANVHITISWDLGTRVLTTKRKNNATNVTTTKTNLTECDYWHYELFQQTPTANKTNEFAAYIGGMNRCKLINMTWRCSRVMLGKKWQTESVQTAKIVLRNAR